jgi:hypothetical protein
VRQYGQTLYLGIAPLLVVAGALPKAHRLARRLLVLSTVMLLVAVAQHMAIPGLSVIGALPGLRPISAVYWAALAAAALTVAVGVSIDTVARAGLSWKTMLGVGTVFVGGLVAAVVANWRPSAIALLSVAIAVATVLVVVGAAWYFRDKPRQSVLLAGLTVGLIGLELVSYQNHTRVERFDYEDDPPAYLAYVQEHLGDGRVLSAGRDTLYPEWGSALGVRQIETLNLMQVPEYRSFFARYLNPREGGNFLQIGGSTDVAFTAVPEALDQLSVRYLIVGRDLRDYAKGVEEQYPLVFYDDATGVRVFENRDAFPRAYLSPALGAERANRPREARWTQPLAFTRDRELLDTAAAAGVPQQADVTSAGDADIVYDRNTRVRIDVDATQPAVLVLDDTYHENWSVTVNGEPAHIGRVNDVVRGVVVPAGSSVVEFRYESDARTLGIRLSLAVGVGLLIATAVWAVMRRRGRSRRADGSPHVPLASPTSRQ